MDTINLVLSDGTRIPVVSYNLPFEVIAVGSREELCRLWQMLTPEMLSSVGIDVNGTRVIHINDATVDSMQSVRNNDGSYTGHFSLTGAVGSNGEDNSAYSVANAILMGGEVSADTVIEKAQEMRGTVEELAQTMSDGKALENSNLFPVWRPGVAYTKENGVWVIDGSPTEYPDDKPLKILHDGVLYYFLQPHTTQADWPPDAAVSLFSRVLPGQDDTVGVWVQPDSTNPYSAGQRVTHKGKLWVSEIENNVWEPGVYGWQEA